MGERERETIKDRKRKTDSLAIQIPNRVNACARLQTNGKENGNYYVKIGYMLGLYRDNGKMETTFLK